MANTIIMIIVIILVLLIILHFNNTNYKLRKGNINFFQGELGSGKSAIITRFSCKQRFKRQIYNRIILPILKVVIWLIPIFNICRLIKKIFKVEYRLQLRPYTEEIYSTFPITQKTIFDKERYWSKVADATIFTWENRVKEDEPILCTDELEYLFPSETKKSSPIVRFGVAWLRHAISPSIYAASQNLDGVNVEFRRRINNVYNLNSCQRCVFPFGLWFSKVQVQHAIVSENFTNVVTDTKEDRENNWLRFIFPRDNYKSRYGKNMYKLTDEEIHKIALKYEEVLKKMGLKFGDRWRELEYKFD